MEINMPLENFDGQTWVAYSDLCGTKAMYNINRNMAGQALDKFYTTVNSIQERLLRVGQYGVSVLVVSDCAIFWIHRNGEHNREVTIDPKSLGILLENLKQLHCDMIASEYMLRSTIAYGYFKYEQRLEFRHTRKDMIFGGAYLDSFAQNDKIPLGSIFLVKTQDQFKKSDLGTDYSVRIYKNKQLGFKEYIWWVENKRDIKSTIKDRDDIHNDRYKALINLYKGNINSD
jgi:hypothetical protein